MLVCSAFNLSLFSQKHDIRGVLKDSTGAPLEMATVMLLQASDSSLVAFARSEVDGRFSLKNQPSGNFLLRATYIGYRHYQQTLALNGAETSMDLGMLKMEPKSTLLSEVQITGEANPVQIKKDTIEFNAGSFNVKDNAVAFGSTGANSIKSSNARPRNTNQPHCRATTSLTTNRNTTSTPTTGLTIPKGRKRNRFWRICLIFRFLDMKHASTILQIPVSLKP